MFTAGILALTGNRTTPVMVLPSLRKVVSACQVRHGGLLGPPIGQYLDRAAATLEEQHRLAADGHTLQVCRSSPVVPVHDLLWKLDICSWALQIAPSLKAASNDALVASWVHLAQHAHVISTGSQPMSSVCAQVFSVKHRRFRPVRCIGFVAEGGAHLLQDANEPSAEVGQWSQALQWPAE
jgi:hypothetical protein